MFLRLVVQTVQCSHTCVLTTEFCGVPCKESSLLHGCVFPMQGYDPTVNYESDSDNELNNTKVNPTKLLVCRGVPCHCMHVAAGHIFVLSIILNSLAPVARLQARSRKNPYNIIIL